MRKLQKLVEYLAPVRKKSILDGLSKEATEALLLGRERFRAGKLDVPVKVLHRRAVALFGIKCKMWAFQSFMGEENEEGIQVSQASSKTKQGRTGVQGKGRRGKG